MLRPSPLLVAVLVIAPLVPASADAEVLTVGSMAPQLNVDHWFALARNPEGETPQPPAPITEFESGGVYVIEFWATWCGPCVMSIPSIRALQEKYRDRGVTVVSVSDEPRETVESFFTREVQGRQTGEGEEPPTYGDLMAAYRVGTDPDGSVTRSYMQAANQTGIPCAFLVGKTGQIEWVGHPMEMEPVIEAVVTDTWDREAFGEQFRLQQEIDRLQSEAIAAARRGDSAAIREKTESMLAATDDPRVQQLGERLLLIADQIESEQIIKRDPERAVAALEEMIGRLDGNPQAINQVTWGIYGMAVSGVPLRKDLLQAAADATEAALVEDESVQGSMLDTIGHLYHQMGDLDAAIAFQRRAVAAGQPPQGAQLQAQIEAFLQQLLEEKRAAEEAPAE